MAASATPAEVHQRYPALGVCVLAFATVAAGILDFIWGDFEAAHQPIQALGDHIPGRAILAFITAAWLVAAGAALLGRRSARAGAAATATIYLIFALFWLRRFYTAPLVLGLHLTVLIGVAGGMFTQLIVAAAGLGLYASLGAPDSVLLPRAATIARWVFGVGSILFGLAHLTGVQFVARMVPAWVPLGGPFWVVVSGIAFVLAGLGMLTGILDALAARLFALMLGVVFEVLVLIPVILAHPRDHTAWGGNAYNLAAAGAAWIIADLIVSRGTPASTSGS